MLLAEHPFASYIRILGKGKKGSRSFTQKEAYQAMRMILNGQTEPMQLGAFLMLMRVKEETAQELAGFIKAIQSFIKPIKTSICVDLDWPSYAGKRRCLPWFILSALLLASNNIRIFMHGARGHTQGRVYTQDMLEHLGIKCATTLEQTKWQLQKHNFSFLALSNICPILAQIIDLRPLLGLRSPVHTLARMINPLQAQCSIQGIFHPSYRRIHQQASLLIGQGQVAVFKGEGGESERNPDVSCLVQSAHLGKLSDEEWPTFFKRRHIKPKHLDLTQLVALWQGKFTDEYAQATVVGTAAIALKLMAKAPSQKTAQLLAQSYWDKRNRKQLIK